MYKNEWGSLEVRRAVWREVTKTPCASVTDIAQRVGRGATITAGALYALKCAGYIHFDRNARNARTILLPFGETVVHPAPQEGQRDA